MLIDRRITRLVTPEGFNEAFSELVNRYDTHEQAYEEVERLHQKYFEVRKYKNFSSFKTSKAHHQKKTRKTTKTAKKE